MNLLDLFKGREARMKDRMKKVPAKAKPSAGLRSAKTTSPVRNRKAYLDGKIDAMSK